MGRHYTRAEKLEFLKRKNAGETLFPGQLAVLENFDSQGEENVQDNSGPNNDDSGGLDGSAGGNENGVSGERAGAEKDSSETNGQGRDRGGSSSSEIGSVSDLVENVLDEKPASDEKIVDKMKEKINKEKQAEYQKNYRKNKKGDKAKTGTVASTDKSQDFKNACRLNGEMTYDGLVLAGVTVMGQEWNHRDEEERRVGRQAYGDMFEHYGWDSNPAWLPCVIVTGSYVTSRLKMPETKERVKSWKENAFVWWKNRKARKQQQKDAAAAAKEEKRREGLKRTEEVPGA